MVAFAVKRDRSPGHSDLGDAGRGAGDRVDT